MFLRYKVGSELTCKKEEGHLVPHSWKPPLCSSPWSLLETQCCLAAWRTRESAACCLQIEREREERERERSARSTYRHPTCLQNKLLAGGTEQASTGKPLESQTTSRQNISINSTNTTATVMESPLIDIEQWFEDMRSLLSITSVVCF